MKVYDVYDGFFGATQIHSVVADNMAQAERLFVAKYKHAIRKIEVHSEYVLVQGLDEPQEAADDHK